MQDAVRLYAMPDGSTRTVALELGISQWKARQILRIAGVIRPPCGNTTEDFWLTFRRDGECLIWQGNLNYSGYGKCSVAGQRWRVHRLSYTLTNGDIPEGMHVLHTCDRRSCGEPSHLFLGTQPDNLRDMREKGRWKKRGKDKKRRSQGRHHAELV